MRVKNANQLLIELGSRDWVQSVRISSRAGSLTVLVIECFRGDFEKYIVPIIDSGRAELQGFEKKGVEKGDKLSTRTGGGTYLYTVQFELWDAEGNLLDI